MAYVVMAYVVMALIVVVGEQAPPLPVARRIHVWVRLRRASGSRIQPRREPPVVRLPEQVPLSVPLNEQV